jgi:hypothetical protein
MRFYNASMRTPLHFRRIQATGSAPTPDNA